MNFFKRFFAIILSLVIIAVAIPSSVIVGFADKVESQLFDGDFELLPTGATPDSWELKSTDIKGSYLETGADYSNSFSLTTANDNGNKVLSVSKVGSGYIGATSNDIKVDASTEYEVSLLYKQVATETNNEAEHITDFNSRLYIGEKNAKGIITLTKNIHGSISNEWSELGLSFTTKEDTVAVVIYLWVGAQRNVDKTVYFDNVSIINKETGESPVSGYGLNLDFESGEVGEVAPCWSKTSFTISGTNTSEGLVDYTVDYQLVVAGDAVSGNKSLAIKPKSSGTRGYVLAESENLPVEALTAYSAKFALKVSGAETDKFLGAKVYVIQFDKDGKEISRKALCNSVTQNTDWKNYDKYLKTEDETASIKFAVWVGGIWNCNPDLSVNIDAISISKLPSENLINGDFESGDSDNDISSWHITSKSMLNEATPDVDYTTAYSITRNKDGYHGDAISVTRNSWGYVTLDSNMIKVSPSTTYFIDVAVKIENTNDDFHSVRFGISEYDKDGNHLGVKYFAEMIEEATDWREVSGSYTPSENAEYFNLEFWCGALLQCYFTASFDDVRITEIRRELNNDGITNGGFEELYNGTVFDWNLQTRSDSTVVSTFDGYNGTKGIYAKKTGKATTYEYVCIQSNYFNVTAGKRYKLEYMSRLENQVGSVYIVANLYCLDKDGNKIETLRDQKNDHRTKSEEWQNTVNYFTIPDGTVKCRVEFIIPGTSFDLWMDDVKWSALDYEHTEFDSKKAWGNTIGYDAEIYGFDTIDSKGNLVGWSVSQPAAAKFDDKTYCEGTGSLFISQTLNTAYTYIWCDDIMPIHTDRHYEFTMKVKSYGCNLDSEGITVYAKMYDTNGKYVGTEEGLRYSLSEDPDASDWYTITYGVGTYSKYGGMQLYIEVGTGTMNFWIDDVQWEVYDEYKEFVDDFDSITDDGTPARWDASVVSGSPSFVSEDSKVTISGNSDKDIGRISSKWNTRREWITCTYQTTYRTSVGATGKLILRFFDYSGKEMVEDRIEKTLESTNGTTQEYSFNFIMPSVNYTLVEFENGGKGSVTFEGVKIQRNETVKTSTAIDEWRGPWIWYDEYYLDSQNGTHRYFRYTFDVDGTPSEGIMQMTADDYYEIYINGVLYETENSNNHWRETTVADDFADYLVPGKNVLAFAVGNYTSYAGLIFDGYVETEDGKWIDFYSGIDTLSSVEFTEGWKEPDFDDSKWTESKIQEYWGGGQWGTDAPFDATAYVKTAFEIIDYSVTEELVAGETAKVTMTIVPEIDFTEDIEFKGHLWKRNTESKVMDFYFQQVEGPKMSEWKAGKEITVSYIFEIPDYIGAARYVVQFNVNQVKVTNMDILNNKLVKATKVTNEVAGKKLNPKLVDVNGTKAMEIDGEIIPLSWFTPQGGYKENVVADYMHSAGIKVTRLWEGQAGSSVEESPIWTGYDEYNFEALDASIYAALADHTDTYLIVSFGLTAPKWWIAENPDECVHTMQIVNGKEEKTIIPNESFGSKKMVEDATKANKDIIEHMMEQPYWNRVVGAVLTAGVTTEWLWYGGGQNSRDYSPANLETFREYMKEKYQTNEALQKAWNNKKVTFDTIQIPTFNERLGDDYQTVVSPETQRDVLDYNEYMGERIGDVYLEFAKNVTEWTDDQLILGSYFGYMACQYYYGTVGYLHTSTDRVLLDENVDFFAGPVNYHERYDGEAAGYMHMIDGILANGKAFIAEDDLRLCSWISYSNFYYRNEVGPVYDMNNSVSQLIRNASIQLVNNVGNWYYDMWSNWFIRDQFGKIFEISQNERKVNLGREKDDTGDVCYIIDDDYIEKFATEFWGSRSLMWWTFHEQRHELAKIGLSCDMYHLSDLKKGLVDEHKVYIMIGCTEIDSDEEEAINKHLKKDDNIVIWNYSAGYSDGKTISAENMSEIIGMNVRLDNTPRDPSGYFTNDSHWLINGIEGKFFGYTESYAAVDPMPIVTDKSATVLGVMSDNKNEAALSIKDCGNWTSIYTVAPMLPTELYRNLFNHYGIHTYSESKDDIIFANSNYVTVNTVYGGDKVVKLDGKYSVYDVYAGKTISTSTDTIEFTMPNNSTTLFRLTPAGTHTIFVDAEKGATSSQLGYNEATPGEDYECSITADDGYVISEIIIDGEHKDVITKSYNVKFKDLDNSHFVRVRVKKASKDVEDLATENDAKALSAKLLVGIALIIFAVFVTVAVTVLFILNKKNIIFTKK